MTVIMLGHSSWIWTVLTARVMSKLISKMQKHTDRSYRHVLYVGNEHQAPVLTNTDGVFDSLELYVRSQHLISGSFMELNLIEADTNTSNGQLMGVLCGSSCGVCLDTFPTVNLDHEVTNGVLRVPINASVLQVSRRYLAT